MSAEQPSFLMQTLPRLRTGLGTDRHRLAVGLPLLLGRVAIESSMGSVAHSDGDVLLHAVIDALLGACAMGDIGEHFPPSDEAWKDAHSSDLLRQVLGLIRQAHPAFQLFNLDATITLEAPKLKPYKLAIRQSLADLLSVTLAQVSVKAKTGEQLAPIGTLEAIDAQVIVLVGL
jgi:2-C-methyl-D-erythritol 2,4-cyclodiphosphate synthase